MTITTAPIDRAQFAREWEEWHRAYDARRAAPHGNLAITGLYWLGEEPVRLPAVPGAWTTGPEGPAVELADGESLLLGDQRLIGRHAFGPIAERGGLTVAHAGGVVEIARRGGRDLLRPRREDHPYLASFAGTPTYLPNPRWRAAARFVPFAEPRPTEIGAAVDGLRHVYEATGHLEFSLRGEEFRLLAFAEHGDGSLLVLFQDATSGLTTYAASRTLRVEAPDADGETVVDFNRAANLSCAYSDFATCPLAPPENRLPIGIEAGEKTPVARARGVVTEAGILPAEVTA